MAGLVHSSEIQRHDRFNLVALTVILLLSSVYLALITRSATPHGNGDPPHAPDLENHVLFSILFVCVEAYLIIDIVWVCLIPRCVPSDPNCIVFHHVITMGIILLPYFLRQFYVYLPLVLLVELNTLCLIARRSAHHASFWYSLLNCGFYVTWVICRLVGFPVCAYYLFFDFLNYSSLSHVDSYVNIMAFAPAAMGVLAALSVKWTLDLLVKKTVVAKVVARG
jgi:hypothetical protein